MGDKPLVDLVRETLPEDLTDEQLQWLRSELREPTRLFWTSCISTKRLQPASRLAAKLPIWLGNWKQIGSDGGAAGSCLRCLSWRGFVRQ